jgi:hypothetical protein
MAKVKAFHESQGPLLDYFARDYEQPAHHSGPHFSGLIHHLLSRYIGTPEVEQNSVESSPTHHGKRLPTAVGHLTVIA